MRGYYKGYAPTVMSLGIPINLFQYYRTLSRRVLSFFYLAENLIEGCYSIKCRENKVFSTPGASIGRMIKLFGVRRVQISSSKPPMLDYTYGQHVANTR